MSKDLVFVPSLGKPNKPFAGVISDWSFDAKYRDGTTCVHGVCEWRHEYRNGIAPGALMYTSPIIRVVDCGAFMMCETENSIYTLVNRA